ncbi:hypothetical protein GPLA_3576 [Paraglaciecola polaris LMG 21857]|uniref:Uncharacterized protein n=1 Tax=Paraglaciecola polaris LMG 21857 TaxID=1129793 RepID=K6YP20_9ALTE|nr:hypothetical protein GPLA_3576 [Paraglaciecola polaris LMG 21857]
MGDKVFIRAAFYLTRAPKLKFISVPIVLLNALRQAMGSKISHITNKDIAC